LIPFGEYSLFNENKTPLTPWLSLYGLKVNSTDTQVLKALFEAYAALTDEKLI
jgi:hypothetical protein